jgi:polyphosphate kinase 2
MGAMQHDVEAELRTPDLSEWDRPAGEEYYHPDGRLKKRFYEAELARMQEELVELQYWVQTENLRVLIIFEGRGSAGKGGVIKRISERTSPRIVRTVALPKPTEREQTQWYFQRYVPHLPSGGEIVLFDRSWYNRSNVEWVMGYCNEKQHAEFLRTCPEFERMLVRSGIILLKYWFSVSYEEQARRFRARNEEPIKRWKLSKIDLEEHRRYVQYSMAKDTTFQYTDIKQAPWYVVPSDCKRRARLNCIGHILESIPYENMVPEPVEIPEREDVPYIRPPFLDQTLVGQNY